jgi:hypothetical protein
MLSYIALISGALALYVAQNRSLPQALLSVYLPSLLLFPDYYRAITPGLPDPTLNQGASVALFLVFASRGMPGYRFSFTDILVFVYAFSVSYSEYQASGYSDAQNLMFFQLTSVLFPYLLAKSLIEPNGLRVEFARQIVISGCLVMVLNLWENKFAMNLWRRFFDPFFPGQADGWVTTFRFGLARAAGPYGHALLAGIMMIVVYRLQRWLHWSNVWPVRWPRFPGLPLSPGWIMTLAAGMALFTTLAKGSWLAAFIAAGIPIIGRSKQRVLAMTVLLSLLIGVGIPAVIAFLQWASVGRMNATSSNQETAAYRYELVVEYLGIANEQMWFGWGLTKWPKVVGMPSIDNFFLLLYLMHGIIAFGVFVYLLVSMVGRLTAYGMRQPPSDPPGSCLAFTLAAIFLAYLIAIATVYLGLQTVPLLFMMAGWAESYMMLKIPDGVGGTATSTAKIQAPYRFRRVL